MSDAEQIFNKYAQDPEVTKYLVWKPHENIEITRKIVASFIKHWETATEFAWIITKEADGELMGMITITIDKNHGVNFGYVLAKQFWGNGYMTEALFAVIDWALQQPTIYRIWAAHDIDNPASGRVMEKAGLKFEGILHKWSIHPNISDKPRDCNCYAKFK